ncbi:MAG: YHS domain-containing protein [bacterium]
MKKIFVIAVLGLSFIGCGKKEEVKMKMDKQEMEHQHEKMQHGMEMKETGKEMGGVIIRKARKDELGKSVVCPVMGTKFNVGQNTEAADYKGKSYYFCCGGCPPAFKNNPEKYITK